MVAFTIKFLKLGVSATGTLIDAMTTGSWQKAAKIILK